MGVGRQLRQEVSAGGVVVRRADRPGDGPAAAAVDWEVLLGEQLDRNTGRAGIRLPKGHPDDGESLEETALREVLEETGRRAEIRQPLDEIRYEYFERRLGERIAKRVAFFLMVDRGPGGERDGEMAAVFWCPLEEAPRRLSFEAEGRVVARAAEILARR